MSTGCPASTSVADDVTSDPAAPASVADAVTSDPAAPASASEAATASSRGRPSLAELRALIEASHDPKLADEDMVTMVWNDGEITAQKAGELLWQRTLHQLYPPLEPAVSISMPCLYNSKKCTSFAFVTDDAALQIRSLMARAMDTSDASAAPGFIAAASATAHRAAAAAYQAAAAPPTSSADRAVAHQAAAAAHQAAGAAAFQVFVTAYLESIAHRTADDVIADTGAAVRDYAAENAAEDAADAAGAAAKAIAAAVAAEAADAEE